MGDRPLAAAGEPASTPASAATTIDDHVESCTKIRANPTRASSHRARLLVVDDDPGVRQLLARQLRQQGYYVDVAASGPEAVEYVDQNSYDVIVSDVRMPIMDGIELLKVVRQHDLRVPVVLLTGAPVLDGAVQALEFGAFHYLAKTTGLPELERVVDRAASWRRSTAPFDTGVFMESTTLIDGTAADDGTATDDGTAPTESTGPVEARDRALLQSAAREMTEAAGSAVPTEASQLRPRRSGALARRSRLGASLDRCLADLWIAYHPIVDVIRHEVFGYEALLRSTEPTLPHPTLVCEAAKRLGRLDDLGRVTRDRAAQAFAGSELPSGLLFVNLHVTDLDDPLLRNPNAPLSQIADRVVLEITERSSLDEVRNTRSRVAALREMGFRIAVDDMGSGYAGLTSLALLEPDYVKLDMSLIRDVHLNLTQQKVIRSVTDLCRDLGMKVVAEGVETVDERDVLIESGCELLQGFLFAKPGRAFPKVDW